MEDKQILLDNISKVHTTEMGIDRIKKNLKLNTNDVVEFCKNKILDKNCNIYKQGKNWYCEIDNIKITINSYSYTIITKTSNQINSSLVFSVSVRMACLSCKKEDLHRKHLHLRTSVITSRTHKHKET